MENKKVNFIFGIIKAIVVFVFRLLLLVPMLMLTIVGAMLGAGESTVGAAIWKCITHPFSALGEAIRNIKYEIDVYKD